MAIDERLQPVTPPTPEEKQAAFDSHGHGHFIEKCKACERVLAQCRCMRTDKPVRWSWCEDCQ